MPMRVIEPVAYLGHEFVDKLKKIADDTNRVVGLRAIVDSPVPPVVDRNEVINRIKICRRILRQPYFLLMTITAEEERAKRTLATYQDAPEVAGLCMYPWDTGQFGIRTRDALYKTFEFLTVQQYSGPLIIHGGSPGGSTNIGLRTSVSKDIATWLNMSRNRRGIRAHLHFPHRWALDDPDIRGVHASVSHGVSLRQYIASPDEGGTWIEGWYDAGDSLEQYLRQELNADGQPLWIALHRRLEELVGHAKAEDMVFDSPMSVYREKLSGLI